MKILLYSFILFILSPTIISITALAQGGGRAPLPCNADFNYMVIPNSDTGIVVEFTNRSTAYKYSFWRFDLTDSSIEKDPVFAYASNLTTAYVCLTITDSLANCRKTYCDSISLLATGINSMSNTGLNLSVYPNPSSDKVDVAYSLKEPANVSIEVSDMLGRRVALLYSGTQIAGRQRVAWQAANVTSGVYMVRITANGQSSTRKLSVVH